MNLKKLNDEIENRMVEIVTIGDYLQMGNVKSDYLLSGNDWSKILGSNSEIMKHIVGWGESNMGVKIKEIAHVESNVKSPKENGYGDFFYNFGLGKYITYCLEIHKKHSENELGTYVCFGLPKEVWNLVDEKIFNKK